MPAPIVGLHQVTAIASDPQQNLDFYTQVLGSYPRRYAGLFALTGGLIGPLGSELTHRGDLAGTPAFFGSSDRDPHVPWSRVQESARMFDAMGTDVKLRRYEHRAHTISSDELEVVHQLLHDAFFASL